MIFCISYCILCYSCICTLVTLMWEKHLYASKLNSGSKLENKVVSVSYMARWSGIYLWMPEKVVGHVCTIDFSIFTFFSHRLSLEQGASASGKVSCFVETECSLLLCPEWHCWCLAGRSWVWFLNCWRFQWLGCYGRKMNPKNDNSALIYSPLLSIWHKRSSEGQCFQRLWTKAFKLSTRIQKYCCGLYDSYAILLVIWRHTKLCVSNRPKVIIHS